MNKRKILLLGIVVFIAAVVAALVFFSIEDDDQYSKLDILGNGTIEENGTLNIKLSDGKGFALKDKEIHVSVKDSEGNIVFKESTKTYVNGVANVKLVNVSSGEYEINATFDGDENYTECSVFEKLIVGQGEVEEETDEDVNDTSEVDDTTDYSSEIGSSSYGQSSSYQSYTPSSSYSYDDSSYDSGGSQYDYYDENGNAVEPTIDENGNVEGE